MTHTIRIAAALALGLITTTAAFAAGGTGGGSSSGGSSGSSGSIFTPEATPPAQDETATIPQVKKKKKKVETGTASTGTEKKKKKAKTKAEPEIVDLWAERFGKLGPEYIAAVKLAKAKKYDEAIAAFQALNKPEDPRVLNWIGFSLRKSGKPDQSLPYYEKAIGLAPDFTPAHEYLGEAYVQLKQFDKAREHLATIEKLCGNKTCEEYEDLSKAIEKAVAQAEP